MVCVIEEILNRLTMINIPGTKPPVEQFPWMWFVNFLKDSADTHSKLNRYLPGFITGHWKDKVKEIGRLMDKLYCGEQY